MKYTCLLLMVCSILCGPLKAAEKPNIIVVRVGDDRLKLGMIISHLPRKRRLFVSQSLALDRVPLLNIDGCLLQ